MRAYIVVIAALALGGAILGGCNPSDPMMTEQDSGITLTDSGPVETCGDPGAPYGTSEGSHFLPFTLNDCDGNPYEFYGEEEGYCETSFTVVTMAAGWCGPCRLEAEQAQRQLVEAYASQGVRIITALIQDNDYAPPSGAFCQSWVTQYGLTNPVLVDPAQETQIYFPAGSLPANLIVDSNGVIRHREYGVSDSLGTIRAALNSLLAEGTP